MPSDADDTSLQNGQPAFRSLRVRLAIGIVILLCLSALWLVFSPPRDPDTLLNVSYDASRDYFRSIDARFAESENGNFPRKVQTLHAGSVRQSRNIRDGLVADVVSLASAAEMDSLAKETGCISANWRDAFPYESSPFTSAVVFIARPENPKNIRNWEDLLRNDVNVAAPSPRESGIGRYAYLAAVAAAHERNGAAAAKSRSEVDSLYLKINLLETGSWEAARAFIRNPGYDVFLTWESEALRLSRDFPGAVEVVYPPIGLQVEPVVAIHTCHAQRRGTESAATAYLQFLFSPEGQKIAAQHGLRPRDPEAVRLYRSRFPETRLLTIEESFGSWDLAWQDHFSSHGTFTALEKLRAARRTE